MAITNEREEAVSITPADLKELAVLVVDGLRAQLAGSLRQDLEQLLREHEQRLLAAVAPKCGSGGPSGSSAAYAKHRGPARRLNQGTYRSDPGRKPDPDKPITFLDRLDPGSFNSEPSRRTQSRNKCIPERQRPGARYLNMNFAGPSMKSITEARDDELLGQTRNPRSEHLGESKATSGGEQYLMGESMDEFPAPVSAAATPGEDHLVAGAPSSSHELSPNSRTRQDLQAVHYESFIETVKGSSGITTNRSSQSQQRNTLVKAAEEQEVLALKLPLSVEPTALGHREADLPGGMAQSDRPPSPSPSSCRSRGRKGTAESTSSDISELKPHFPRSRSRLAIYPSDARAVRLKREEELLGSSAPACPPSEEGSSRPGSPRGTEASDFSQPENDTMQRLSSPLPLRICGILSWGWLGVTHRWGMLALAAVLVGICAAQLYHAQVYVRSPVDCRWGVCIHFGCLNDLLLAVCSLLGLLAMRKVSSLELLGSPTTVLVQCAVEHHAVQKWSSATLWQSFNLTVLWIGSLAFRAVTMRLDPSLQEVIQACTFVLTSAIFLVLVFGIQHVSCCISVLIDSYVLTVQETMDPVKAIRQWDKLGALLRKVSRAVDWGFLLVQTTAVATLLLSIASFLLQGNQQIWRLISDALLAQSLVLLLSKAAEATEMCTRMPALVNSLDFGGDDFSHERHYLVEHITYSAAGFYVGEVRLTAVMALKLTYVSILAAFGVLTKITTT